MTVWGWGVDLSTTAISIAGLSDTGKARWITAEFASGEAGARRLAYGRHATIEVAHAFGRNPFHRPSAIVVEDPRVGQVNMPLLTMFGVVLEAMYSATRAPVLEMGSSSWKAEVIGNGGAKKPRVMAEAIELGYTGSIQDEADALCIAKAALRRAVAACA